MIQLPSGRNKHKFIIITLCVVTFTSQWPRSIIFAEIEANDRKFDFFFSNINFGVVNLM